MKKSENVKLPVGIYACVAPALPNMPLPNVFIVITISILPLLYDNVFGNLLVVNTESHLLNTSLNI